VGLGGVASQVDNGKTSGFSAVWPVPPQKRTLTPETVRASPLLLGHNQAPFGREAILALSKSAGISGELRQWVVGGDAGMT
jgi:hypothetical protein